MRASLIAILASFLLSTSVSAKSASVWVSPFAEADEQRQPDWISRSLHQSLVDELAMIDAVDVQMSKEPVAAQYIVRGTVHRADGELRVTGNVTDADGNDVGGFKATGLTRDLFAIQDDVAEQVAAIVTPEQAPTTRPATARGQESALIALETPFAPVQGGFAGLDREMSDYMRRPVYVTRNVYPEIPNFNWGFHRHRYPGYLTYPTYRYGYGGYGYGHGYGHPYGYGGFGGNQFIFVNSKFGGHTGSFVPSNNGQAIRARASWSGNPPPTMIHTPAPGVPQLVPGPGAGPQLVPGPAPSR